MEKIRFVCGTRLSSEDFFKDSPLGKSLQFYRTFPKQDIELRLFQNNSCSLSVIYNEAIEESKVNPAVLVFIHDDVYLSDYYWALHLMNALKVFQIVGIAGNKRRIPAQCSWMYLNDKFESDSFDNLSGVIGHGNGFPDLRQLSVYGEPGQAVKLLDGVMLAVRSQTLIESGLRFDPRFDFHFYDMDFCRQADALGVSMGTWPISLIHGSIGRLGGQQWLEAYQKYRDKYGDT